MLFELNRLSPRAIIGYSKSGNPKYQYDEAVSKCFNLCVMEYVQVIESSPETYSSVYQLSMELGIRSTGLRSYYQEQLRQKNKSIMKRKPGVISRLEKQVVDDGLRSLVATMVRWSDLSNVRDMVLGHTDGVSNQPMELEKQSCTQFIQSAGARLKGYEDKIQFLICGNDLIDYYPNTMPASFWKDLKMYACSCNDLKELILSGEDKDTGEVISMPNMLELYASHNAIKYIDPNIAQMKSLTLLDLACNRLDSIPHELFLLQKLKVLDLSSNKISAIPSDIGRLSELQKLYLDDNSIETLPFNLFMLEKLSVLHLQNNQLRKLPPTLASMNNLSDIKLDNNPYLANTIPKPVLMGSASILKNFLEESNLRGERCYRTKLMIVGQENVGKTSLLKCLVEYNKYAKTGGNLTQRKKTNSHKGQISGKPLSTDGIDIHNIFYETEVDIDGVTEKKDITFNVWDFAGQEVYYTTHSFFLTDRSVFVIVFNLLLGADNCRVEYWLNSVKARSPNSPILLVGTHLDSEKIKRSKSIQEMENLLKKYKRTFKIRSAMAISCETNENIAEFVESLINISIKEPYMGSMIPSSYFTLEDLCLMERRSKELQGTAPICQWDEIKAVALKSNFMSGKDFINDEVIDSQLSVAIDVLHLLGSVVRFKDVGPSLDKVVILDPQWITKVFSTIITTKRNFVKDGVLEVGVLFTHVWKEFPSKLHVLLLGLLESFEIVFRLPDYAEFDRQKPGKEDIRKISEKESIGLIEDKEMSLKSKLLIPSLLSEIRPEFNLIWPDRDPDPSRIQYSRLYKFIFMPNGLFSRFIIRLLKFSDALRYWRYGLLLKAKRTDSSMALIELDQNVNKITIQVRGESPAEFFRTIIELLDSLLHHWFKVPANISAVCPICIQNNIQPPTLFTKEECLDSSARGSWFLQCQAEKGQDHLVKMEQVAPDIAMADFEGKRIDLDREVTIEQEIGKGAYGTVYKGLYNKEIVAIKKLIIAGKSEEEAKDIYNEFRKEVWIMSGLQHPCIVNLKGFSLQPSMAMVMEIVNHGDLHQFLANKDLPLDWGLRLRIAWDIAKGLAFLHSTNPPLLHRDVKSPNILLANIEATSNVVAKIADFGLTGHIFTEKFAAQKARDREVVNPVWLAPEIMREQPYATAADVYPYGIILWELYTRKHPFDEFNYEFMSDMEKAIKDGTRPTIPEDCPDDYAEFIKICWDGDPQKRPSFKVIVEQLLPPIIEKYAPEIKPSISTIEDIEKNSIAVKKEIEQAKEEEKPLIAGTHLAVAETSNDTIAHLVSVEKHVWCITIQGTLIILNSDTGKLVSRFERVAPFSKLPILGLSFDPSYKRVIVVQPNVVLSYAIKSINVVVDSPPIVEGSISEIIDPKKKKKKLKFIKVDEKTISIYRSKEDEKPEHEILLADCIVTRIGNEVFSLETPSFVKEIINEDIEEDLFQLISTRIEAVKSPKCKLPSKKLYESKDKISILSYHPAPDSIVLVLSDNTIKVIKGNKVGKVDHVIDMSTLFTCSKPKICYLDVDDLLWLSYESDIHIIDIDQKKVLESLRGHNTTINSLLRVGKELWSYSIDNYVKVWSLDRKLISSFKLHHYVNCMLKVGPDILVSQINGLYLYNASKKESRKALERRHEDPVKAIILVESEARTVWTLSDVSLHIWK